MNGQQRAQGGSRLRSTARQRGKLAKQAQALRRPSTLVDSGGTTRGKPRIEISVQGAAAAGLASVKRDAD